MAYHFCLFYKTGIKKKFSSIIGNSDKAKMSMREIKFPLLGIIKKRI